MLLSTPDQVDLYHGAGLWGNERLDQIFVRHVEQQADELAFIDDQNLHAVSGRQPQCLSFARAWKRVVGLSSFLTGVGMKSDTVVAMLMPPSADAAILTLVASRMGLVLAPIPLTSGEVEIHDKIEQIGAKAIVCCSRYEDEPVAERARNVAADMFSIRFVFCIGDDAPEGLIELHSVMDDEDSVADETLFDIPEGPSADAVLAVHWSSASSHPAQPIGRSHNQLLSCERMVHEHTGLEAGDCIMVAHHLSGLNGFVAGLIGAVDAGARIQFAQFTTLPRLVEMLAEFGCQHVMVPGGKWPSLHGLLPMNVREQLKSIALVWHRTHAASDHFRDNETAARLLDLTNFSDLALHCQIRRHPGEIGSVSLGRIHCKSSSAVACLETHLFGMEEAKAKTDSAILGGELCIKGAMVPQCAFPVAGAREGEPLRATDDGFVHAEIACHLVTEEHGDERAMFRPLGDVADVLAIGALTERAEDLDALYKSCVGVIDAAAFLVPSDDDGPAQLMAALVVDDNETAETAFFADLQKKKVSSMRTPRAVYLVQAIPRFTDGRVQRNSLIEVTMIEQVA